MTHGNQTWSEEQDAQLQALERLGLSASLIGERLGKSKGAVVGRSYRLRGYSTKGLKAAPRTNKTTVRKQYLVVRPRRLPPPADSGRRMIGFLDLNQETCRWPHGERAPFLFCGAPGTPYCAAHARIAFRGVSI